MRIRIKTCNLKNSPLRICFFSDFFLRAEERKEREREREPSIGCLPSWPNWGSNLQTRYLSWPGVKHTTFWSMGQCCTQLSHPARAKTFNFPPHLFYCICSSLGIMYLRWSLHAMFCLFRLYLVLLLPLDHSSFTGHSLYSSKIMCLYTVFSIGWKGLWTIFISTHHSAFHLVPHYVLIS